MPKTFTKKPLAKRVRSAVRTKTRALKARIFPSAPLRTELRTYSNNGSISLKGVRLKRRLLTEIIPGKRTRYRTQLRELQNSFNALDDWYRYPTNQTQENRLAIEQRIRKTVDTLNKM
jgi:hypothetical protein